MPPSSHRRQAGHGRRRQTGRHRSVFDEAQSSLTSAPRGKAEPPPPFDLFWVEVTELSTVRVEVDHLVIESRSAGRGVRRIERC
ncbi:MAG: hypothetical protein ACR2N4_10145 [Jatrophihabitans sp.]